MSALPEQQKKGGITNHGNSKSDWAGINGVHIWSQNQEYAFTSSAGAGGAGF